MTSRSRIVRFERNGDSLRMLDDTQRPWAGSTAPLLAKVPIRGETPQGLELDLNAGFDKIFLEEDRTGEDYYGRVERHDDRTFELLDRTSLCASRHESSLLVFDQQATSDDGKRLLVHYYLSPYRPDPEFQPFEMKDLKHFGFYETYPQRRAGKWVLYATKFGVDAPIVFALSSSIPTRYREAVRDGALYWNRALGQPLIQRHRCAARRAGAGPRLQRHRLGHVRRVRVDVVYSNRSPDRVRSCMRTCSCCARP